MVLEPMSFTSCSVKQSIVKKFDFVGSQGPQEYLELKSDRFERKGTASRKHKTTEEVVVAHYRDSATDNSLYPLLPSRSATLDLERFPYSFEKDSDVLRWACAMAMESPSARILLIEAQEEGWVFKMEDLSGEGYGFDDVARVISLDHFGFTAEALGRSGYFRNAILVNFIKLLRQIWHDRSSHDFTSTHRADAALMLERARAADCETFSILVGWELRGAGHADVWRAILGSDEGDMAMIFTRAMEKDPAGFYDGSVLTRTFCQWYGDESRVAACDHAALERMDQLLQEAKGAPVFGNEPLRANTLEKLSTFSGGRPYLTGMGRNICTDPYFMAINDAINESHLFQVVYDSRVVLAGGVPFRDAKLARLIFPGQLVTARE